ncbi:MAG: hypothetical protein KA118_11640 [Verrucomicrobia bacterium]|nr:hypothetical protein [Verrucomicrobiota bacterium]
MNLDDVLYALFRHKWLIFFFTLLGIGAAAYLYLTRPMTYRSEARLIVRYVRDSKTMDASPNSAQVSSPDSRGENILNNEVEILTSFDLARQVAELVGAEKILGSASGSTNPVAAAVAVQKGLVVEIPRKSNSIRLAFEHTDPETAQTILRHAIDLYRRKHAEVHRALGFADEFLNRQTDELRTRLAQTEDELRKLKTKAGIFSVEESKKAIADQLSKIQQELLGADAELAQRRTALEILRPRSTSGSTNPAPIAATNPSPAIAEAPPDPETIKHYSSINTRLESFRQRELDLLSQFSDENTLVKDIRIRIAEAEKLKKQLEENNPRLLEIARPASQRALDMLGVNGAPNTAYDLELMASSVAALEAKVAVLKAYMDKVKAEAATIDASESQIVELERQKSLQEANYRYFAANLEQARIDEALGTGNLPNISVVQEASPPFKDGKNTLKMIGMVLAGGFGAGLVLAGLLEFFVDRTIRKPAQIVSDLRTPLFLTVPVLKLNGRAAMRQLKKGSNGKPKEGAPEPETAESKTLPVKAVHDPMGIYSEALRDRLMLYFQINGLTHRPKLVGVTGCSRRAGVTTFAAGLASSLSETGDGNVLLVDMNSRHGAGVHPFYRGEALCGLNQALERETRSAAMVQENLYVVTTQSGNGSKVGLVPKKFANMVPLLQATDYDYIIFDLPPVTQTSPTSKLAGLLDMTVMVLESERSHLDAAKRAVALLSECKAKVSVVLNKHKTYGPHRIPDE